MQKTLRIVVVVLVMAGMPWMSSAQVPGYGGIPPPGPSTPMAAGPAPGPAPVAGPPAPAAPTAPPSVSSSHCLYLMNAPSPWGKNASPFKLYTRSHASQIRRGYPVEVSILPYYKAFQRFNFTDFGLWAETFHMRPGPNQINHDIVGVWQVFPQYAGGSGSMKCSHYARGEDMVGSFEGRMLDLLKTQMPFDTSLMSFAPSARSGAAFLWYPDERTMRTAGAIKFVAKVKAFGMWFTLESSPWRVYKPPPPPPRPRMGNPLNNWNAFIENVNHMNQRATTMERQWEAAGNGAL